MKLQLFLVRLATFYRDLRPKAFRYVRVTEDSIIANIRPRYLLFRLRLMRSFSPLRFKQLVHLTCVDYPNRVKRFQLVYVLLSTDENIRLILKVDLEDKRVISSVQSLYSSATWYEREVWDIFGVVFLGNSDLRRILTDYGFPGHPLRKDFPLLGYEELRYTELENRVVAEAVEVAQEFRTYEYNLPWAGPKRQ